MIKKNSLTELSPHGPIGIFDSGIGGLSVLIAIQRELPGESLHYLADQAHVPYGHRQLMEVRSFSEEIARYLLSQGVKIIVVACNAASAAALTHLRQKFPQIDFVGMEPAVKPAAENTESRVVAVLATPATFQGALYASVVERFAGGVEILQATCPGLVERIETGDLDGPLTRQILEKALRPMLIKKADTVVLGCTHYPFVIPLIEEISGPDVRVIDPAPAVARQVRRILETRNLMQSGPHRISPYDRYETTGNVQKMEEALQRILNLDSDVTQLSWKLGKINNYSAG